MKQDHDNMAEHKSSKVLSNHVDVLSAVQGGYRITWRPSTRSTCALLYMYCLCYNVSGGLSDSVNLRKHMGFSTWWKQSSQSICQQTFYE